MSSKRWAVVAAGILIAGVVAADVLRGQFASYDSFEATTLAGDRWRLDDYRGQQPVLVVFGATWCQPCHIEFPLHRAPVRRVPRPRFGGGDGQYR